MSNVLAVAAVTTTLRYVLDRAIKAPHPGPVGGANVTTKRPADLGKEDLEPAVGINVWCYQVTPNHAIADDLPARRPGGGLAGRPVASLDLHYLVSFYGNEQALEPQRLLGRAALAVRTASVLGRDVVKQALEFYAAEAGLEYLVKSDLGDDVELVKLAPLPLSLEELSKLWGVLGAPYLLSLTYVATAVVLTSSRVPVVAPPVARRVIGVGPGTAPRIDEVRPFDGSPGVPAATGSTLVVSGSALLPQLGTATIAIGSVDVAPAAGSTRSALQVIVPPQLPAGMHPVSVRHRSPAGQAGEPARVTGVSNGVPLVVRPTITSVTPDVQDVSLAVTPAVRAGQDARLLLTRLAAGGAPGDPDELSFAFPALAAGAAPAATLTVPRVDLLPGSWLVRLQVDGVQSLPTKVEGVYAEPVLELP